MRLFSCKIHKSQAHLILALLFVAAMYSTGTVNAFKTYTFAGGAIHENITRTALVSGGAKISKPSFTVINKGNYSQDALGSPEFLNDSHHFDNCKIKESLAYVESCYSEIRHHLCLAGKNKTDQLFVLRKFGQLLHPLQDFYSHSNYVELQLAKRSNLQPAQLPLVDWKAIPPVVQTGFFYFKDNTSNEVFMGANPFTASNPSRDLVTPLLVKCGFCRPGTRYATSAEYALIKTFDQRLKYVCNAKLSLMHRDVNKDNDATEEGKIINPSTGTTLFAYAENLAVRETARQWQRLENEVKGQCSPVEAPRIIKALRAGFN